MPSDDEKKVIAYSQNAFNLRADFFEAAAKRHPEAAKNFNELAIATRDMGKMAYVADADIDPALKDSVMRRYPLNTALLLNAAAANPALVDELRQSQKVLLDELNAFETRHPELVPVREAMLKKQQAPKP